MLSPARPRNAAPSRPTFAGSAADRTEYDPDDVEDAVNLEMPGDAEVFVEAFQELRMAGMGEAGALDDALSAESMWQTEFIVKQARINQQQMLIAADYLRRLPVSINDALGPPELIVAKAERVWRRQ
jgi:hypothetical protein